jgi:hypothetical protein
MNVGRTSFVRWSINCAIVPNCFLQQGQPGTVTPLPPCAAPQMSSSFDCQSFGFAFTIARLDAAKRKRTALPPSSFSPAYEICYKDFFKVKPTKPSSPTPSIIRLDGSGTDVGPVHIPGAFEFSAENCESSVEYLS